MNNFEKAKMFIPHGLNSPFRSFNLVGGDPVFMASGNGSKLIDISGNTYIDYSLAWGPMILGHSNKKIQSTIKAVSEKGWCFGTPTEAETKFAQKIQTIFPSMEKIRLTNSGTEAVMSAIRLARGYKKKSKIILFDGNYHGHSNETLVSLKNDHLTVSSSGVPANVLESVLIAKYNNINSVEKLVGDNNYIAAILIEPVATNMGLVLPQNDFLKQLRELCDKNKILLIFDEVVTGLRISLGGAQEFYKVIPDITVLGKAIGGGLPVGAFGAKSQIMDILEPEGNVYTAGTFSGNPMTTYCGIATLNELSNKEVFENLIKNTKRLCEDIKEHINQHNFPVILNYSGSIFSLFFTNQNEIKDYDDVKLCDFSKFAKYFHYLLDHGIYLSPSGEDVSFLSTAHTEQDIKYTASLIKDFLKNIFKTSSGE